MEKFIITISREFGSQGHEIGNKLAKRLGVKFYDETYFDNVMKRCKSYPDKYFENVEEYTRKGIPIKLWPAQDRQTTTELYYEKCALIRVLSRESSCIFVDCCADYILKDYRNMLNVFIYSSLGAKMNHLINRYSLTEEATENLINCMDNSRHSYYKYFTKENRSDRHFKNFTIDSSYLGVEHTVDILEQIILKKYNIPAK